MDQAFLDKLKRERDDRRQAEIAGAARTAKAYVAVQAKLPDLFRWIATESGRSVEQINQTLGAGTNTVQFLPLVPDAFSVRCPQHSAADLHCELDMDSHRISFRHGASEPWFVDASADPHGLLVLTKGGLPVKQSQVVDDAMKPMALAVAEAR